MKKIFLILFVGLLLQCKDKNRSWIRFQPALKFAISDSNIQFKLFPKDSIGIEAYTKGLIYYDSSGVRKEMSYSRMGINEQNNDPKYYISIGGIAEKSSLQNIKIYYISWRNGETDTLFANYKRLLDNDNMNDYECRCNDPLIELRLNGKTYLRKTDYNINGIYIFDR